MSGSFARRAGTSMLWLLLAASAGALAHVLARPVEPSGAPRPQPARSSAEPLAQVQPLLEGQPLAAFPETVARPLFTAARRPARAAAAPETGGEPPPNPMSGIDVQLAGIVREGTARPRALLIWPGQPAGRWLEEGDEIDDWRLTVISRSDITLLRDGRHQHVKLD